MDFQLGNKLGIKTGSLPTFHVQDNTPGPGGRQWKLQLFAEGVPIILGGVFPATEPLQAVSNMRDFILVDLRQKRGRFLISCLSKTARKMPREIEICLLESEAESGHVIDGRFHTGNRAPKITADG